MKNIVFILFNLPPLVILIGAFILFFKGKCNKSVRISMSVLLWILAVAMALYAEYFNPVIVNNHFWVFDFVFCLLVPFCPPVYFLFLNRLTDKKKTPGLNILTFLPAILFAAMLITAKMFMSDAERHAFVANEIMGLSIQMESSMAYDWMVFLIKRVFGAFLAVEGILVMIYGEFRLNTYIHLLEKYYTTTSSERKRRVRGVHLLTLVVASLFMFMSIIPLSEAANMLWFLGIVLVIEMVMVTMIVSYVMKIEYSAEDLYALMEERDNNNNNINNNINNNGNNNSVEAIGSNTVYSPVVGDDLANARKVAEPNISAPLIVRIDAAMEKDNLFLNPDLSLVSFSEQVGSNRTYVSKAIKDAKGCSFSDYVNRYRLDYALELMKNTSKENMVIQNIATQCGCGSVQTFYRYFKLFFNETPTQWIERNK